MSAPSTSPDWDAVRRLAPGVTATLVRRHGDFDACEDAVQEALAAAAAQWPVEGPPSDARAWLVTVAGRRLIDRRRSDAARRAREQRVAARRATPGDEVSDVDDTLLLLLLCCHPSLSPPSQLALTLRAVAGLTTAEIARAFLVPEATMAQRISRAKQRIREHGARFELPGAADLPARLRVVRHALYVLFTEGHTATSGADLLRPDLAVEAIRLARAVHAADPSDGEAAGLLALLLLTDARRDARTSADGALVPLAQQDRARWDAAAIAEGVALVTHALATAPVGPYQVQAAIAAVHAEADSAERTDWAQILALYDLLERLEPGPVVTLNRAVAVAMVHGPAAGLELVDSLGADPGLVHRVASVRAHLLEMEGRLAEAHAAFREAARRTTNGAERRYLLERAHAVAPPEH